MAVGDEATGAVNDEEDTLNVVILASVFDLTNQPLGEGGHDGPINGQDDDLVFGMFVT